MSTVESERLAEVFVELADTLVDEFDLVEFLQVVAARVSELSGAGATGLLLAARDDGRLRFMAASDERVHLLELFQLQADEGPCLDCFREGVLVLNTDLVAAQGRWPAFAPQAVALGFRSVHAFPLRLRRTVIGALGLFHAGAGTLDPADVHVFQALADVATIGLLQEQAIRQGEILTAQLQGALHSRIVIEQAKGIIAQLYGVDLDAAFGLLRGHSRRTQQQLAALARSIVADPSAAPDLRPPPPRS